MLKFYGGMMKRLSKDEDGVVSLEYVAVAACVIVAVIAAYKTGSLPAALVSGFGKVTTAISGI